jgi:tryptophanyl-tRNA synthetase
MLFERIDREIAPMRERYDALVANPQEIERILQAGARKVRERATPFMAQLRHAVGLRNLASVPQAATKSKAKAALPSFKQYREADGRHYFKLVDAAGGLLLQSTGFASPQDAGRAVARLKQQGWDAGDPSTQLAPGMAADTVRAALAQLAG